MNYERYIFSTGMLSANPAIYSGQYYAGSDAESFYDPHQYSHLDLEYPESLRCQKRPYHASTFEKPSSWETDESGRVHHVYHGRIREIDGYSIDEELDTSYHDMLSGEDQDNFAHILTDPLPSHTTPPPTPILDPSMVYHLQNAKSQRSQRQVSLEAHGGIAIIKNSDHYSDESSALASSFNPHISGGSFSSRSAVEGSTISLITSAPLYGFSVQTDTAFEHLAESHSEEENFQASEGNDLQATNDVNYMITRDRQGRTPGILRRQIFTQIHKQHLTPEPVFFTSTTEQDENGDVDMVSTPNRLSTTRHSSHWHPAHIEEADDDDDTQSNIANARISDTRNTYPQPLSTSLGLPLPASRSSTSVPRSRELPAIYCRSISPDCGSTGTHSNVKTQSTYLSGKSERPPHVSNHTTAWHALNLVNNTLHDLKSMDTQHLEVGLRAIQRSLHRQRSIAHEQWVVHSFEWYEKYKERVRVIEVLVSWARQSVSKTKPEQALSNTLLERLSSVGTLLSDIASKLDASFDRLERRHEHILKATPHPPPHQMRTKIREERLAAVHAQARYDAELLSTVI